MSECLYRDIKYEDILSNGWANRIKTLDKAFTLRFVLGTSKLRKLLSVVTNIATVDAPGYVYPYIPIERRAHCIILYVMRPLRSYKGKLYIHIGVGFVVARSTTLGNAKASKRGTGNRLVHAFFVS